MSKDRINEEIKLLRKYYPNLKWVEDKSWVLIPDYKLPEGLVWNKLSMNICFQIPSGYPATPPYGIYVPSDLLFNNQVPLNFQQPAKNSPPFEGIWGILSWAPVNGEWKLENDILKGSNLLNLVSSFSQRFKEGR